MERGIRMGCLLRSEYRACLKVWLEEDPCWHEAELECVVLELIIGASRPPIASQMSVNSQIVVVDMIRLNSVSV